MGGGGGEGGPVGSEWLSGWTVGSVEVLSPMKMLRGSFGDRVYELGRPSSHRSLNSLFTQVETSLASLSPPS